SSHSVPPPFPLAPPLFSIRVPPHPRRLKVRDPGPHPYVDSTVTTIAAASVPRNPPPFWASATRAPATGRCPHRPRSCSVSSTSCPHPVAPIGCPFDSRPPLGLTGTRPPSTVAPEASSTGPSPSPHRPGTACLRGDRARRPG